MAPFENGIGNADDDFGFPDQSSPMIYFIIPQFLKYVKKNENNLFLAKPSGK